MRASEVAPKPVEWLWRPYFPLGKLSAVAGAMGQAKSLLTIWLADFTTAKGASVVMLSAEDDPADTIRPRLEAAKADLYRVEISSEMTLNAAALGELCDEIGNVPLITVDPIQAYLPSTVNAWKGQDVRLALEPIRQLAAERKLAIVLIQHLNRRNDSEPLARIADSQGIPQLCRSVCIWGLDPSDPDGDHGTSKVLTQVKGNLAPSSKTSPTFTITERTVGNLDVPVLVRGADSEVAPDEVVADFETRSASDEAGDWLRELLTDGPVAAKDALRQAREIGLSERTVRRAKAKLHIVSEPSKDTDHLVNSWVWRLPDKHSYTNGNVGNVGSVAPDPGCPDGPDCHTYLPTIFER